jgi:hypothetical protein
MNYYIFKKEIFIFTKSKKNILGLINFKSKYFNIIILIFYFQIIYL